MDLESHHIHLLVVVEDPSEILSQRVVDLWQVKHMRNKLISALDINGSFLR